MYFIKISTFWSYLNILTWNPEEQKLKELRCGYHLPAFPGFKCVMSQPRERSAYNILISSNTGKKSTYANDTGFILIPIKNCAREQAPYALFNSISPFCLLEKLRFKSDFCWYPTYMITKLTLSMEVSWVKSEIWKKEHLIFMIMV